MTAAISPHKGVVKPDAAYYGVVLDVALRSYWRSYRFWQAEDALLSRPLSRRYRDEYRGKVVALCNLRRACRPVRLGGA